MVVGVTILLGVIMGTGIALLSLRTTSTALLFAVIGVAGLIGGTTVAVLRFEWVVLGAIFLRIAVDGLRFQSVTMGTLLTVSFAVLALMRLGIRIANKETVRPSPLTKALCALVLVALVSAAFSDFPLVASLGALQLLTGVLMFVTLEQELPGNPTLARRLIGAIMLSTIVPFIVGIYQFLTESGNHDTVGFNRISGTAVHPTPFSSYLLIVLACVGVLATSRSRVRLRLVGIGIIGLWLLLLTYTRSAWIAAVAGALYMVVRTKRRLLLPLSAGGVAIYFFFASNVAARLTDLSATTRASSNIMSSLTWRVDYWRSISTLAQQVPITGIGLDVTPLKSSQSLLPHNIFVQTYVELGYLGCVALLAVMTSFLVVTRRRRRSAVKDEDRQTATVMGVLGIVLLVQGLSSNILTQAMIYWYVAAASSYGHGNAWPWSAAGNLTLKKEPTVEPNRSEVLRPG